MADIIFPRCGFAPPFPSRLPVTSIHVLNEAALPVFETHEERLYTILSDNGREFCGRSDHHLYELFLQLEGIEYRTTKVRRPQSMALSSDCTAPCWMNTSVSREGRPGMSRCSRCRQTWIVTLSTTTSSGHIKAR
jgi:hypothetical protein